MGKDTIPGPFEAYCEATQHSPAPLPEEVAADLEEATKVLRKVQEVLRNEDLLFAAEGLRCVFHVLSRHASQARRLAEVEEKKAQLSNTVEMVKHGLNGPWEPDGDVAALTKEAGDALQSIGLLRAIGDWNTYRELPKKVEAIQLRAEAAEARVKELEGCISAAVRGLREFFPGVELAQNIADTLEKNATEASA